MLTWVEFFVSFILGSLFTLLTSLIPIYLKILHDKYELRKKIVEKILIEIQYNQTIAEEEKVEYARFLHDSIDDAIKSGGMNLLENDIIPDLLKLRGEYYSSNKKFERLVTLTDSGDRATSMGILFSEFDYSTIEQLQDKLVELLNKELEKNFLRVL